MIEAKLRGGIHGISISPTLSTTSLVFVDDVLFFCNGLRGDIEKMHNMLDLFSRATDMQIKERKSTLSIKNMEDDELAVYRTLFPYNTLDFDAGLKYRGFHLNANCYKKNYWS